MRVISRKRLRDFWSQALYSDAEQPLRAWFAEAQKANWKNFGDVKRFHAKASLIGNSRVCFNICNNKYRLIVAVDYNRGYILIKWIGTHEEYDRIDPETIGGT